MERFCKNCKHFVVTGTSFDPRSKLTSKYGVCHKPDGNAKKVRGKLVGGDLMWDDETCKAFKQKRKQSSVVSNEKRMGKNAATKKRRK